MQSTIKSYKLTKTEIILSYLCDANIMKGVSRDTRRGIMNNNGFFIISSGEEETKTAIKRNTISNKQVVLFFVIILAVIGITIGFCYYKWYNSPKQIINRALANDDYVAAVNAYKDSGMSYNARLDASIITRLEYIKSKYTSGEIDYKTALTDIDKLREMAQDTALDKVNDAESFISTMKLSEDTYYEAISVYENKDYKKTILLMSEIPEADIIHYAEAQQIISKAKVSYREEVLLNANELVENGERTKAIIFLKESLNSLGNDNQMLDLLHNLESLENEEVISNLVDNVTALMNQQDYLSAISIITSSPSEIQTDERVNSLLQSTYEQYFNYIALVINGLLDKSEFDEADKIISDAVAAIGQNDSLNELSQKINSERNEYIKNQKKQEFIAEAEAIFKEEGYSKAVAFLRGSKEYSNDEDIKALIEEYSSYKPVELFSLESWDTNCTDYGTVLCFGDGPRLLKDNFGAEHSNAYKLRSHNNYAVYRIDGVYNRLTGSFSVEYQTRSGGQKTTFNVYGDDVLLYTYTLGKGMEPVNFDIDISGVVDLKIESDKTGTINNYCDCILYDVYLAK